jgi:TetR/AcrR family transcriptional regulator, mexJK operon transcriptional repressor
MPRPVSDKNKTRTARPPAKAAAVKVTAVKRLGGRPSKAAAGQLEQRIIDAGAELFYSLGYGATTIEAVAQRAGVSKRTFYDRYEDKAALLSAVVHRTIERMRPPADVPILRGKNLEEILQGLAALILRAALSPPAIALNRLIVAESGRFPDLAKALDKEGATQEAIRLIAGLLTHEKRASKLALRNPAFIGQQFLHMLIAEPQRRAMGIGTPMTPAEINAWGRDVVELFLDGCRA